MKNIFKLLTFIILLILPSACFSSTTYISGEVIVKFKSNTITIPSGINISSVNSVSVKSKVLKNILSSLKVKSIEKGFPDAKTPIQTYKVISGKQIKIPDLSSIFLIKFPTENSVEQVISELKKLSEVEYAHPNHIIKAFITPNDSLYNTYQWNMSKISAEAAWDITTGDSSIIVAVADTGIDYNHEDLSGKIILGYDYENNDSDPIDDNGHGTHVAGVIGAITNNDKGVAGLNWGCKIMAVKIMGVGGYGSLLNASRGIEYAASNGAKIISMSFGIEYDDDDLKDTIINAYSRGCILVAAAGNENKSSRFYPAGYDDYVIAVAATDQNDLVGHWGTDTPLSASNYGEWIDVCAPGTDIVSTWKSNNYANQGGTSMAAPHVAALAALILSKKPSMSQENVRYQIENSCINIDSLNPSYANLLGYGRINAALALGLPIARITQPENTSYVHSSIQIKGTATSTDFSRYQLQIGSGTNPATFETFYEGVQSVDSGILGTFDTTTKEDGPYIIKLTSQSQSQLSSEASITINIDNTEPKAKITSPENNAAINDVVTILGIATDINFNYYTLSYAKSQDTSFINISSSTTQKSNNILGDWNTIGLSGLYKLKLTVADKSGRENSETIDVNITSTTTPSIEIQGFSQPSPNPFNPKTQNETFIYYNLSNNFQTSLYILNISGELVYKQTFQSGQNGGKAGENLVTWNGHDPFGATVGNGVYLYKITSNNKILGSGRIIVIR
ncbi:hypothetical protein A2230_03045 [candidate division WOR-1 bacterium RIFOXYA2_FULL_36_21]|uniref:Uncharacterized protein n=1 Tax=candidate division WOR-1 bacterium RIFOXYB2_FULL_36_35 TaxID=1802578 RepID=A0A1F4S449_UNCSA|nr:MAG: hypothetical protein A2230_03045 [candidate division WOR-1 bacterium RIFOXYA2_FULL_36_21]OGC15179.1 MAG: hypothetical protein A2290_08955 [candidate division WOR-1 bacterium RIFOXYB2_FULL_36_35]OGC19039.1 MAG: hypothetical protein A2282_01240 [candidate division WOR-1 bacterium RIFOXYA12_FULL_36_13]